MKTRIPARLVITAFVIATIAAVSSCQKSIGNQNEPTGSQSAVNIYLTDDPSLVFDQLWLDIQQLEIKVEDDQQSRHEHEHQGEVDDKDRSGDHSGGWITVNIRAGLYDILQLRNGLDTLLATASFPVERQLKKLRITLGNKSSVLINGNLVPLIVKGNNNFIVIKLEDAAVNFTNGGSNHFWIDIDAGRSISRHGNEFELKPSVKLFSKEATGRIEGRVLPAAANAVVTAISATDTATAKPEREGEFKFAGLKAGTYSIIYHATAGNYMDTTISNVQVRTKEDTKLPTITLHK